MSYRLTEGDRKHFAAIEDTRLEITNDPINPEKLWLTLKDKDHLGLPYNTPALDSRDPNYEAFWKDNATLLGNTTLLLSHLHLSQDIFTNELRLRDIEHGAVTKIIDYGWKFRLSGILNEGYASKVQLIRINDTDFNEAGAYLGSDFHNRLNPVVSGEVDLTKITSLSILNDAYISGNLDVSGELKVLGPTSFHNLNITGELFVSGESKVSGTFDVDGPATISGLIVEHKSELNGDTTILNLTATNEATFSHGLTVDADGIAITQGGLTVTNGDASFGNNVTITEDLVARSGTFNSTLTAEDKANISGDLTVKQDANISGNLNVATNVAITGLLTVKNDLYISNNVYTSGNQYTKGENNISGILKVSGEATLLSGLNVRNNVSVSGTTNISGLNVYKNASFYDDIYAEDNLNISGNLKVSGSAALNSGLTVSGGELLAQAGASLSGTINISGKTDTSVIIKGLDNPADDYDAVNYKTLKDAEAKLKAPVTAFMDVGFIKNGETLPLGMTFQAFVEKLLVYHLPIIQNLEIVPKTNTNGHWFSGTIYDFDVKVNIIGGQGTDDDGKLTLYLMKNNETWGTFNNYQNLPINGNYAENNNSYDLNDMKNNFKVKAVVTDHGHEISGVESFIKFENEDTITINEITYTLSTSTAIKGQESILETVTAEITGLGDEDYIETITLDIKIGDNPPITNVYYLSNNEWDKDDNYYTIQLKDSQSDIKSAGDSIIIKVTAKLLPEGTTTTEKAVIEFADVPPVINNFYLITSPTPDSPDDIPIDPDIPILTPIYGYYYNITKGSANYSFKVIYDKTNTIVSNVPSPVDHPYNIIYFQDLNIMQDKGRHDYTLMVTDDNGKTVEAHTHGHINATVEPSIETFTITPNESSKIDGIYYYAPVTLAFKVNINPGHYGANTVKIKEKSLNLNRISDTLWRGSINIEDIDIPGDVTLPFTAEVYNINNNKVDDKTEQIDVYKYIPHTFVDYPTLRDSSDNIVSGFETDTDIASITFDISAGTLPYTIKIFYQKEETGQKESLTELSVNESAKYKQAYSDSISFTKKTDPGIHIIYIEIQDTCGTSQDVELRSTIKEPVAPPVSDLIYYGLTPKVESYDAYISADNWMDAGAPGAADILNEINSTLIKHIEDNNSDPKIYTMDSSLYKTDKEDHTVITFEEGAFGTRVSYIIYPKNIGENINYIKFKNISGRDISALTGGRPLKIDGKDYVVFAFGFIGPGTEIRYYE
jgi:hypothetical protein